MSFELKWYNQSSSCCNSWPLRAELKLAEACQLLTLEEQEMVFPSRFTLVYHRSSPTPAPPRGPPLLAVDVGAAPGGWTGYLAALTSCATSVVAIGDSESRKWWPCPPDPAVLEESVAVRDNVRHLKHTVGHSDVKETFLDSNYIKQISSIRPRTPWSPYQRLVPTYWGKAGGRTTGRKYSCC